MMAEVPEADVVITNPTICGGIRYKYKNGLGSCCPGTGLYSS